MSLPNRSCQSSYNEDPKVTATTLIWIMAMFMVLFPTLFAVKNGGDLGMILAFVFSLFTLGGATLSSLAIWGFLRTPKTTTLTEEQVKKLEERVANLETIISFEEPMLRTKIANLRSLKD